MSKPATASSMMVTRVLAVSITFGVGAASFALSFTALRDLATRCHIPAGQAGLFPLMVDGAILLATLGVVVMAGDPQCRNDRRFFWLVLCGGAAVSIGCNALHAMLPPDQPISAWLRGFLAAVAPVWLLVTTHGLTLLLTRIRRRSAETTPGTVGNDNRGLVVDPLSGDVVGGAPASKAAQRGQVGRADVSNPVIAESGSAEQLVDVAADTRWHTMAPRVLEQLSLKNAGCTDVAQVLYLSYERALADREIGRQLGLDHHTVAKIVRAADAHVQREHQERVLAAS